MERWALIIDWIGNEYADLISERVQKYCRLNNKSLLIFTLGYISYTVDEKIFEDQVLPILKDSRIDRVLIFSSQIVRDLGGERLMKALNKVSSRPIICMEGKIPGYTYIHCDYQKAYIDLLNHLWDDHGYRDFAWISGAKGNPDAEQRMNLFLNFLASKNIILDPELNIEGNFNYLSGTEAGLELSEYKGNIDVIVAANDTMALGAWQSLRKKIPVVGFDNHSIAAQYDLSTIDPELESVVDIAIDQLENWNEESKKKRTTIELGKLAIRRSCGCKDTPISTEPDDYHNIYSDIERQGEFFEYILETRDMSELASTLNHRFSSEEIFYWDMMSHLEIQPEKRGGTDFIPKGRENEQLEIVLHSLFRGTDLYGYFMHDISNMNYQLSERLRGTLSLTLQKWQNQNSNIKKQKLLDVEIQKFTRRQKEIETVINSLPLWIVEIDKVMRIRYMNDKLISLLGERVEMVNHAELLPFININDRERVQNSLTEVLSTGINRSIDFSFKNPIKESTPVIGTIHSLTDDGGSNISGLFGSIHGGCIRLIGLELKPFIGDIVQPEQLLLKHIDFSKREKETIELLAKGFNTYQLAQAMSVSENTVRVRLHNIYIKSGVSNKKEFIDLLSEYSSKSEQPYSITQVLLSRIFAE